MIQILYILLIHAFTSESWRPFATLARGNFWMLVLRRLAIVARVNSPFLFPLGAKRHWSLPFCAEDFHPIIGLEKLRHPVFIEYQGKGSQAVRQGATGSQHSGAGNVGLNGPSRFCI